MDYELEKIDKSINLKPDYFYIYVNIDVILPTAGISSAYSFFFNDHHEFLADFGSYFFDYFLETALLIIWYFIEQHAL